MSYILDALKRADAERVRGVVPGLHAHQSTWDDADKPARHRNTIVLGMLALAIVGSLSGAVWFWRSPAPAATVEQTAQATTTPSPAPATSTPPPTAAAPAAAVGSPPSVPPPSAAPAVQTTMQPVAIAAPKQQAVPTSAKPTNAGASTAAAPALAELPDDLRRQMPTLAITGAVYSENPGQRLLLINGQVLPQGSAVAPDVTLEEIRERYSIFNFRGTRFRVAH